MVPASPPVANLFFSEIGNSISAKVIGINPRGFENFRQDVIAKIAGGAFVFGILIKDVDQKILIKNIVSHRGKGFFILAWNRFGALGFFLKANDPELFLCLYYPERPRILNGDGD